MYFLSLSLFQFAALFGSISAVSVALYLLDRSRRKQIVSTLRFWVAAAQPGVAARRRRIQQPWSLILQLVSMALLLLSIAQLRFGAPLQAGHDHATVLATSAWLAPRAVAALLCGPPPTASPPPPLPPGRPAPLATAPSWLCPASPRASTSAPC